MYFVPFTYAQTNYINKDAIVGLYECRKTMAVFCFALIIRQTNKQLLFLRIVSTFFKSYCYNEKYMCAHDAFFKYFGFTRHAVV